MRGPVRFALLNLWIVAAAGCGVRESPATASDDPAATIELDGASGTRDILTALHGSHAAARERVGPHRLEYRLELSMIPTAEPGLAPVGDGVPTSQSVKDTLELVWASSSPNTFRLEQRNDHDRGRAMIVVGDDVYTRLDPRGWHRGQVESDGHELWLDDAFHAAGDALELVAPWASLSGAADGELLTYSLSLADDEDATLRPTRDAAAWRGELDMKSLEGTLTVHGPTRTWRSLELRATFGLDGAGTPIEGSLTFSGTLEPIEAGQGGVTAPAGATPVPERVRYAPERRALLDGLAAP